MRVLFARYELVDAALKVVGVGSVGTRCALALLRAGDDALLLQIKQATRSVLAEHLPASEYRNQGERVVRGQRLMQAASDVFLGWASAGGHHFYVRQFKDKKATADLTAMDAARAARVRRGLRAGAGRRARALGRRDRDRRLPRQERRLRPRPADLRAELRRPDRAGLRRLFAAIERGTIQAA